METLSNLKIGTELIDTKPHPQYGLYSNIVITDIKETKTGRLSIGYKFTYTTAKGEKIEGTKKIGHNALCKSTLLSDYCFKIK